MGGGTAKCLRANAALAPTDNAIIDTKPIGGQNDPVVLGWTRDHKGNIIDRHPVEVANCVTAAKRDNTSNYVVERNEPINVDEEGNAKCLRAGYFKAGAANFKEREDGFAQTAVKVNNKDGIK